MPYYLYKEPLQFSEERYCIRAREGVTAENTKSLNNIWRQ